jgi:hypothetical protein
VQLKKVKKEGEKKCQRLEKKLQKGRESRIRLNNPNIPKERRRELVKQKIAELSRLEAEILAARQNLTALCMGTI